MRRYLLLIILSCSSCTYTDEPYGVYRGMEEGVQSPEGTPLFQSGWKDGCHSGFPVAGSMHYKMVHSFNYEAQYITNSEYNEAWHLGFNYCRWYTASWYRVM